jgi:hypothetical protein
VLEIPLEIKYIERVWSVFPVPGIMIYMRLYARIQSLF